MPGPGYSVREAGLGLFGEWEASPGDGILPQGAVMYEKVGRLKPDSVNDLVLVIVDGQGDIGTITREEDLVELLSGVEPQTVLPSGEVDLSESNPGGEGDDSGRWPGVCRGSGAGEEYAGEVAEEKSGGF